jgi:Spy/CpxP family protein refolding chaperone
MLGFLLGTACLIGFIKIARGSWHGYRGHGWGRCCGAYGGDGPRDWHLGDLGSRGFGSRFLLRSIFERLETTPGQEKAIVQAAREVKSAFRNAREKLRQTRGEFAHVFRGDAVDEAALSDIFVTHDTVISETRRAAVEGIRKAHEALTEEQRMKVADFIERGPGGPRHWM